jgi:DNA-binding NtrC family response regulator
MSSLPSVVPETVPNGVCQGVFGDTEARRTVRVLVVSSRLEVRQPFLRKIETLAEVTVCSNRTQAEEVLARQSFDLVFCDEYLPEGSYCELIHANHWEGRIPRVVVLTANGDWSLYFEALAKGAYDVIRWSACITDVEMTIIRSLREQEQPAGSCNVV